MIQNNLINDYLKGDKFSNGAIINLNHNNENIFYRDEYLLKISKNKKILHLGFVDHLPLIDEKISKENWLHKKLMEISEVCYGVDINKEGIEYIQNKYNYENLYALDIINDVIPDEILNTNFDYLLIPDVIEHIGNPVDFLSAIRKRFHLNVDKAIITTPNAFRFNNFINSFRSREVINTDHRFWFTPYTISKILTDSGYKINSLGFFEHGKLSKKRILKKLFLSKYCTFKDTLIVDVNLK